MSQLQATFDELDAVGKELKTIQQEYSSVNFPSAQFFALGYPVLTEALEVFSEAGNERVKVLKEWCRKAQEGVQDTYTIFFGTDEEQAAEFKAQKRLYK